MVEWKIVLWSDIQALTFGICLYFVIGIGNNWNGRQLVEILVVEGKGTAVEILRENPYNFEQ